MKPLGIIQSRGLGDIVIALPIADYYRQQGREIYWPICEEFVASFRDTVPWVHWIPVHTDPRGLFFLDTPTKLLADLGITEADTLYLYQYLNSVPERTDPDLFAMMKFDQYKYAQAQVPFKHKWQLAKCITRQPDREQALYEQLVDKPRYMVYQQRASDVSYDWDLSWIDPEVQRIEITEHTDSIWDWLKILEGAETMILIDSVFANIVDQMNINPDAGKYYARKWNRSVDGNPVFLNSWQWIEVEAPAGQRVTSLTDLIGRRR